MSTKGSFTVQTSNQVLKNCKILKDNQYLTIDVHLIKRRGTKAPYYIYYKCSGRWITPYEQHRRNWPPLPMPVLFKLFYSGTLITNLIHHNNPLLAILPKNDIFTGSFYPIPLILGE